MSTIISPDQIESDKAYGVLIDDSATFNLPMLQLLLGGIKADSAKKWAKQNNLPTLPGKTWIFTGRLLREALERSLEQNGDQCGK